MRQKVDLFKLNLLALGGYWLLRQLGWDVFRLVIPLLGFWLLFFNPVGLILSLGKQRWNLVTGVVICVAVSMLLKPTLFYVLLSVGVSDYGWGLWWLVELVLLVVGWVGRCAFKREKVVEVEVEKGDLTALAATMVLFVVLVVITGRYAMIPSHDPYFFKNVTDHVLKEGRYPKDFEPYAYYAYYSKYEPLYPVLMSILTISTGLNSFFVYKYLGLIIPALSLLVFYWSIKDRVERSGRGKIAVVLLVVFLSFPHYMLESLVSRPWVVMFYFFPLLAEFLRRKNLGWKGGVAILTILLVLSQVHIFYLLLVPVVLICSGLILLPKLMDRGRLVGLWVVLIILTPVGWMLLRGDRTAWVLSLVKFSNFRWVGLYSISDYIYYLGVFIPLFSLVGVCLMVRRKDYEFFEKYIPFGLMVVLCAVVNEIFTRFGVKIVNERFVMFFGLGLVPLAVYSILWVTDNFAKIKIWVILMMIPTGYILWLVAETYVLKLRSLEWISRDEAEVVRVVEGRVGPGSIVLTQPSNYPLIRYGLPGRYLVSNLTDSKLETIFYGLDDNQRINIFYVINDVRFRELLSAIDDIRSGIGTDFGALEKGEGVKGKLLLDVNGWLEYYNRLTSLEYGLCRPLELVDVDGVDFLRERTRIFDEIGECLSTLDGFNARLKHVTDNNLYLVYSFDRSKSVFAGQEWWDKLSYNNSNLGLFERRKDCFEEILRNKTLGVWKFKKCLPSE